MNEERRRREGTRERRSGGVQVRKLRFIYFQSFFLLFPKYNVSNFPNEMKGGKALGMKLGFALEN